MAYVPYPATPPEVPLPRPPQPAPQPIPRT